MAKYKSMSSVNVSMQSNTSQNFFPKTIKSEKKDLNDSIISNNPNNPSFNATGGLNNSKISQK